MARYSKGQYPFYLQALRTLTLLSLLALGLAGCTSVEVPSAPTLSLTPTAVKTFHLSWDDVDGETEYRLLEDPTGTSGYTQVATIDAGVTEHELVVSLPNRINARYILQACNSAGCSDSAAVYVSGTLTEVVGYVKASNTGEGDEFGYSVALSGDGNTLAVGAIFRDVGVNNAAEQAGAVYVFTRNGSTWSEQAYLRASNAGTDAQFGFSVALSDDGDTLAVGAPTESSSSTGVGSTPNNDAMYAGAAYVFTRNDDAWDEQAYIKASNTDERDSFGVSVALSDDGDTLAVGARWEDSSTTGVNSDPNNDALEAGAAYVFTRNDATWSEQAYIKASNTVERDRFGTSVALSGNGDTLAVGVPRENSNTTGVGSTPNTAMGNAGAVYVFTRSGVDWSEQAYIKASSPGWNYEFGYSVALSADGNTLAVGVPFEGGTGTGVGSTPNDDGTADESGAAYVFTRSGGLWSEDAYIKASNPGAGHWFGYSVALSGNGNTLAVGALFEDSSTTGVGSTPTVDGTADESGAAYVFTRSGGLWSENAYIKASNTGAEHRFGLSVALSNDGDTLAVGAPLEDSSTTGVDSTPNDHAENAGAVYLY